MMSQIDAPSIEHIEGCTCPCCGKTMPVKVRVSGNVLEDVVTEIGWGQIWGEEPYPVITAEISIDNEGLIENIDYLKEAAAYRKGYEQALKTGHLDEYVAEHSAFIEKSRLRADNRSHSRA